MKPLFFAAMVLIASSFVRSEIKTEKIDYKQGDTELQGTLAYDDAVQGKRPGVLVVHEWWGHDDYADRRATDLAKLGYVAFALDMYGKGKATDNPKQAGEWAGQFYKNRQLFRDRAAAGLDVLSKNDRVDPAKIAAIGYCFGGTTVLELARSGAPLLGVVSFHGGLQPPEPKDLKDNLHNTKILVEAGGDDPMVPAEHVVAFEKEMRDAGADWQVHIHGGAQHSFSNPAATGRGIKGIAYNENADKRSWDDMKRFFEEIFK